MGGEESVCEGFTGWGFGVGAVVVEAKGVETAPAETCDADGEVLALVFAKGAEEGCYAGPADAESVFD